MNEEKEWLNEWTDEIETVMTNRAACVSTEGELPRDDYLGEKGQKEHNGAPVQVKFTPCAEPHLECLKEMYSSVVNLCRIFLFFVLF